MNQKVQQANGKASENASSKLFSWWSTWTLNLNRRGFLSRARRENTFISDKDWAALHLDEFHPKSAAQAAWVAGVLLVREGHTEEREARLFSALKKSPDNARSVLAGPLRRFESNSVKDDERLDWIVAGKILAGVRDPDVGISWALAGERELFANALRDMTADDRQEEWLALLPLFQEDEIQDGEKPAREPVGQWRERTAAALFSSECDSGKPIAAKAFFALKRETPGPGAANALVSVAGRDTEALRLLLKWLAQKGALALIDTPEDAAGRHTALMQAAWCGNEAGVEMLLSHADPKKRSKNGGTALLAACGGGNQFPANKLEACAHRLMDATDAEHWATPDEEGFDALYHAAKRGLDSVVLRLLDAGVKPSQSNAGGLTSLMAAVAGDPLGGEAIRRLAAECDPNARDANGYTALMMAARNGGKDEECEARMRALVEMGGDPNAKNKSGETALFLALHSESVGVARALSKLCDGSIVDGDGQTALEACALDTHGARYMNQESLRHQAQLAREMAAGLIAQGNKSLVETVFEKALAKKRWEACEALAAWAPAQMTEKQLKRLKKAPRESCERLFAALEARELQRLVEETSALAKIGKNGAENESTLSKRNGETRSASEETGDERGGASTARAAGAGRGRRL